MTPSFAPLLIEITAYARAGALEHAWALFEDAGLGQVDDDPAVLALKGRLLKDRALETEGASRRAGALAAAAAYGAAARLRPATYPLVNAATLSLIGGEAAEAARLADEVLALLDSGSGEADTPYYIAATRAEALLLTGRVAEARAALGAAIGLAPQAWEDHASTLRQFAVLLAEQGEDAGWLAAFRPPRSTHFGGRMQLAEDEATLAGLIDELIARERIGFGFGSLAAGADLVIAERLIAAGADLHIFLPGGRQGFFERSVRPFGERWPERFEAALAAAVSVREVGEAGPATFDLSVELADDVAMGHAVMNACTLQSEPVQILLGASREGVSRHSARAARAWRDAGLRQHFLPPSAPAPAGAPRPAGPLRLAALLAISLADPDSGAEDGLRDVVGRLPQFPELDGEIAARRWTANGAVLAFASPRDAATAALALKRTLGGPVRIAGHYGLVAAAAGRAAGLPRLFGPTPALAERILALTPAGAVYLSEDFAAALRGQSPNGLTSEFVGEMAGSPLEPPVRLHGLKAARCSR